MFFVRKIGKPFFSKIRDRIETDADEIDWEIVNYITKKEKISVYKIENRADSLRVAAALSLGEKCFSGSICLLISESDLMSSGGRF